jgi:hypothetical protein
MVDLFLLRSSENCSLNLPDFQVLSQSAVAVYCGVCCVLFSCVWVSGLVGGGGGGVCCTIGLFFLTLMKNACSFSAHKKEKNCCYC